MYLKIFVIGATLLGSASALAQGRRDPALLPGQPAVSPTAPDASSPPPSTGSVGGWRTPGIGMRTPVTDSAAPPANTAIPGVATPASATAPFTPVEGQAPLQPVTPAEARAYRPSDPRLEHTAERSGSGMARL